MRLHVLALPHTQTDGTYPSCAYTGKVERFCRMMVAEGMDVRLYSGDRNTAVCMEHVRLFTEEERQAWYPAGAADRIQQGGYGSLTWDPAAPPWRLMNARAVAAILERAQPRDVLCLIGGTAQQPVADAIPGMLAVEWGVGYEGVFAPYRVYESAAWMHYLYGKLGVTDGRFYDAVIPNFYDPADFDPAAPPVVSLPGDYLLFVGRCIYRKGIGVAAQVAERVGLPLVVAGYGCFDRDGRVHDQDGNRLAGDVRCVGPVAPVERARLMARARVLLAPTLYVEPFGGVAVEAMLSGTPAVTTDFGAFRETVEPGRTGERFSTLAEGVQAVEHAAALRPLSVRRRAVERFGMRKVAPAYTRYLERLQGLWGAGWNA